MIKSLSCISDLVARPDALYVRHSFGRGRVCLICETIMLNLLTIGQVITTHRKAAKLTQVQLAERSRVSRATIAALETGAMRELGYNKVMQILSVLGLDLRVTAANLGRPTLEDLLKMHER